MSNPAVSDEEELYRRIRNLQGYYVVENGKCSHISSQAFSDRGQRISVNRADLCDKNPSRVQNEDDDAVVSILTEIVRVIELSGEGENKKTFLYKIDVEPKPLQDNPAHAEIFATPDYATKSTFRRLCEKLSRLYDEGKMLLLIPPVEIR